MKKIFISPSKYLQGEGELTQLGAHIKRLGKRALLVVTDTELERFRHELEASQGEVDITMVSGKFRGECSKQEIHRLEEAALSQKCDVIVGVGGGKALDTSKCVAHVTKLPCIVVPTIASTDAPCSSVGVLYTEDGSFDEYWVFDRNPDLVLVDTTVIAKAPRRFLVAGMGDALSTYFEARACLRSFSKNIPGGLSTKAGFAIAKLCYETLLEDSTKALAACDAKVVTQALENIVEANILLSGLGFESSGLAAAHAVHNGLTALHETHSVYHGEKVAFGVLVQLVLENADQKELNEVLNYCLSVGLPTCLADLGVSKVDPERLIEVAKLATAPNESIHNMPFAVTPESVYAAIVTADRIGASAKHKPHLYS